MSKIELVETGFKLCGIVIEAISKGIEYNQLKEYCKDVVNAYRKALEEIKRITQINQTLSDSNKYLKEQNSELLKELEQRGNK